MKNIFKTSKCAIIAILTFCLLFCISGTQVFAAIVEATEDTPAAIEDTAEELMPMMARSCIHPGLSAYLNANAKEFKFIVNEVRYGHDIPLSDGYYYHAGQFGGSVKCCVDSTFFVLHMDGHMELYLYLN